MRKSLLCVMVLGMVNAVAAAQGAPATQPASANDGPLALHDAPATAPTTAPALPTRQPLMGVLDKAGVAWALDNARINIYGFAEAGYFYDTNAPKNGQGPTYIGFNSFKNQAVLDQADLIIERTVDATKRQFDIGFRLEGIYGLDAQFIHSDGLGDTQSGEYQWDLLQAYVDFAMPGIPLRIRVGKWIELAGYEQYSANIYGAWADPSKALYSHSYQFMYAEPGTQTGVLGTYVFNSQWTLDAGVSEGWNQSTRNSNGDIDFLGRLTYTPSDKTSIIFTMTEGPEFPPGVGHGLPPGDSSDYWTALGLVVTQKITDKLGLGLGVDYVNAPHIPGFGSGDWWGGAAGYATYSINSYLTWNTRVEWYEDDAGGFSNGAPFSARYYEATMGLAIKPMPNDPVLSNLLLRPEVRYDYSDHRAFNSGNHGEFTVAMDVIFQF